MTLEELQIKFTAQTAGLTSQLNGVKQQLAQVGASATTASGGMNTMSASATRAGGAMAGLAKAAKLFIGVYLGKKLFDIGKASLSMANDAVESESLFEVSMKGMANDARKWSDDLQQNLGLNGYALRKNAGMFNVMFNSMGLGTTKSYELATSLTELSEDMGSFYNISSDDMFDKLRSGITGMGIPLKQLGIIVDDNMMKQYAMSEGISKTGKDMTEAQKVMARYAAIIAQTSDAQGDLARTIDSPVNKIRVLNNTLNMAKIALGQAFQPIQSVALTLLQSLANMALKAAQAVQVFMSVLGRMMGINTATADTADAGAKSTGKLADGLQDAAKGYAKAGGAAKKAGKDAKVGLKAFDEINKITEDEAKKAGGAGGGISETPEVVDNGLVADSLAALELATSKAAEALKKLWGLALPTREAMGRLWESVKVFGGLAWDGLTEFYNKFLVPIGSWAVTDAIPAFLDMLKSALDVVNIAIVAARPSMKLFYDSILVPFGNWAGDKIIDALKWLRNEFEKLGTWIGNNQEKFDKFVSILLAISAAIAGMYAFKALLGLFSVKTAIGLLVGALIWTVTNWDLVKEKALEVWEAIKKKWGEAEQWWLDKVCTPINNAIEATRSWIATKFNNALSAVHAIWQGIKDWWESKVTTPINDAIEATRSWIGKKFNDALSAMHAIWSGIEAWWKKNVSDPIETAINKIKDWWEGLKSSLGFGKTQTINIETIYSTKGTPYAGQGGKLEKVVEVPATSGRGGNLQIQPFAKGGVFKPNKPLIGMLGDQTSGMNIETPEALMRDVFRAELSGFSGSANSSDRDAGLIASAVEQVLNKLNITLNMDGEQVGRMNIKTINNAQRMAGRVLLEF